MDTSATNKKTPEKYAIKRQIGVNEFQVGLLPVATLLVSTSVVDAELGDLSEGTTFLTVVHNKTTATSLSNFSCLLDGVDEVWTTSADVGSEDVRAVAFVMRAESHFTVRIVNSREVSKDVGGSATNARKEDITLSVVKTVVLCPLGQLKRGSER